MPGASSSLLKTHHKVHRLWHESVRCVQAALVICDSAQSFLALTTALMFPLELCYVFELCRG